MHQAPEIETIVRVVLQRLAAMGVSSAPAAHEDASQPSSRLQAVTSRSSGSSGPTRAVLQERVVTLRDLESIARDTLTLQVMPRAVVTPAVVDELRDRGIELVRAALPSSGVASCSDSRLLVVGPARRRLAAKELGEFTTSDGKWNADVCRIAAHLNSGGRKAVWISDAPFAALRASVSNTCLRAVPLHDLGELEKARVQAAPNVLIIDDGGWDDDAIKSLASCWMEDA